MCPVQILSCTGNITCHTSQEKRGLKGDHRYDIRIGGGDIGINTVKGNRKYNIYKKKKE